MGLFGKKREKVIDFSERYGMSNKRLATSRASTVKPASSSNSSEEYPSLGFVGDFANNNSNMSTSDNISWDNEPSPSQTVGEFSQKKNKLAKRLLTMTDKIEDLSNQIYHLKQRIEMLEKKTKISYD